MTKEQLIKFFEERPAINKNEFSREAGITRSMLDYLLNGDRRFTDNMINKLLPVMWKYGWVD